MELDAAEAGLVRADGGGLELVEDARDVRLGRRARDVGLAARARAPRSLARERRRGPQAAVKELHEAEGACLTETRSERREARDVLVAEDTQLAGPPLPVLRHVRRAGLDDAEAPPRAHHEPLSLVVRERAIRVALRVGQRREPRAVLHGDAVPEDEWLVEKG